MNRTQIDHGALAEHLSELPHPDQDADDAVFAAAYCWSLPLHGAAHHELDRLRRDGMASFTARSDAAIAAVEKLIPGAIWTIGNDGGPNGSVMDPRSGRSFTSVGATPALALLSACFHVLSKSA